VKPLISTTCGLLFLLGLLGLTDSSAQVIYNTSVDLTSSTPTFNGVFYRDAFSFNSVTSPLFSLTPGQTVSGTITFGNYQVLALSAPLPSGNEYDFSLTFNTSGAGTTSDTATVQLLGLTGQLSSPNPYPTSNAFSGGPPTSIDAYDTITGGNMISFTGFSFTMNMSIDSEGQDFTSGGFVITAPSGIVVEFVPEPNCNHLILVGLLLLSWISYNRRLSVRGDAA